MSSSLCTRYCQKEQTFQVSGLQIRTCVEAGPEDGVSVPRDFTTHSEAATSLGQFCQFITVRHMIQSSNYCRDAVVRGLAHFIYADTLTV